MDDLNVVFVGGGDLGFVVLFWVLFHLFGFGVVGLI